MNAIGRWTQDEGALALLESTGNPFESRAYRDAFRVGYPRWVEASFGAVSGGTRAAIALLAIDRLAECMPLGYGGIASERALSAEETESFLEAARYSAGARTLRLRSVADLGSPAPGTEIMSTSVVELSTDPEEAFDKGVRYEIRKAEAAGASVRALGRGSSFPRLYGADAKGVPYDQGMIMSLVDAGMGVFYDVEAGGVAVASILALKGDSHWVYWQGTQTQEGRDISANYLAMRQLLRDARAAGVGAVNLGSSVVGRQVLEGVARFKRALGGQDRSVRERMIKQAWWQRTVRRRSGHP